MAKDKLSQYRRYIAMSYVFMFLALFTLVSGLIAYWLARHVNNSQGAEVWLNAQSLWIMRNVMIYLVLAVFALLWFIPLHFYTWDSSLWVTATTVIGVIFAFIAFIYLLNAWIKGLGKFFQNKAVF